MHEQGMYNKTIAILIAEVLRTYSKKHLKSAKCVINITYYNILGTRLVSYQSRNLNYYKISSVIIFTFRLTVPAWGDSLLKKELGF